MTISHFEMNTRKILAMFCGDLEIPQDKLIKMIRNNHFDINIVDEDGFGILFYFLEWGQLKGLKTLLKNKKLSTSINLSQNLQLLVSHSKYRELRYLLKKHKKEIQENKKLTIYMLESLEDHIDFNGNGHNSAIEEYLLYLSIIENKLPEKEIKNYTKKFKKSKFKEIEKVLNIGNKITSF